MNDTVIWNVVRPDEVLVDFFADQTAADIHEPMGKRGAMAAEIGPVAGPSTLCGPAVTARIPPGDNTMVHVPAHAANPGDVVVIASETTATATWGELSTRNALRKGLSGVVSDGNVRDIEAIDELGFPVFSRAVSQSGARKGGTGSVNVPVSVGGALVQPGDIVAGDMDGVTVVPHESAAQVRDAPEAKQDAEDEISAEIADGESLYDLLDIAGLLEESRVDEIE